LGVRVHTTDKSRSGTLRLGNITSSRDAATAEEWPVSRDTSSVTDAVLADVFQHFVGEYEQVHPSHPNINRTSVSIHPSHPSDRTPLLCRSSAGRSAV